MVNRREIGMAAWRSATGLAAFGTVRAQGAAGPTADAAPVRIAMLLFPGMTALDLVGPRSCSRASPPAACPSWPTRPGRLTSDTGLVLHATTRLADCPKDLDVLFVPGGDGTPDRMRHAPTLDFLRDRASRARWVTSVCTGSLILGAAGLLDGYRATSHWSVRDSVLPLLGATPVDERVVFDRNRVTAAGISAGLDFALALARGSAGPTTPARRSWWPNTPPRRPSRRERRPARGRPSPAKRRRSWPTS